MKEVLETIDKIISKLDNVVAEYKGKPAAGSQFEKESLSYPDKTRISEAFSFGRMSLIAGQEHLTALPYLAQNNIFATAIVARAILEASSLAVWLLDPSIDETERVKRGLIELCNGKAQIRKFYEDVGRTADVAKIDDFFDNRLPKILAKLGLEFRNDKGNITKPQNTKPQITKLIDNIFGKELKSSYRILSGVAHGQKNILAAFGWREKTPTKNGLREIEYEPNPLIIFYSLQTAIKSYVKAMECYFEISGWDFSKVKPSFNDFFISFSEAKKIIVFDS